LGNHFGLRYKVLVQLSVVSPAHRSHPVNNLLGVPPATIEYFVTTKVQDASASCLHNVAKNVIESDVGLIKGRVECHVVYVSVVTKASHQLWAAVFPRIGMSWYIDFEDDFNASLECIVGEMLEIRA
jgi:hypothetical protein